MRLITVAAALLLSACVAVDANAQCCGQAYSSYYAPAYTTAYAPAAYQSYYSGWYPGYWMDRASARLWGSPSTYVASYPSTYYASYRPAYYANYGYATSYAPACSSCSAGYAPSTCSSCSAGYAPCSSCGTYTTSYAPACSTCASPCSSCSSCSSPCESCSGCSSCSAQTVTQASYQPQQSCGCGHGNSAQSTYAPQNSAAPAEQPRIAPAPSPASQPNGASSTPELRPSIDSNQQSPSASTYRKMPSDSSQPQVQPLPASDSSDPYKVNIGDNSPSGSSQPQLQPQPASDSSRSDKVNQGDNSTYLQAPKLFINPRDRTAQRSIVPVRTAVYEQPVSYQHVPAARTRITAEEARQDAIGWTSASK